MRVVPGQKRGRQRDSGALNKAVNVSDTGKERGEDGRHAERRGERGFSVVEAKANTCRRRRGEQRERQMTPTRRLMSLSE